MFNDSFVFETESCFRAIQVLRPKCRIVMLDVCSMWLN